MSSTKRIYSSGRSGQAKRRGSLISIGVQRKLFAITAMLAAFVTMAAGTVLSLDVFAGADDYVITYNANVDNVEGETFSTGTTYGDNSLPSSTGRTAVSTTPTAKGATFVNWKIVGKSTTVNPGAEIAANQFTSDGTNMVCHLVAVWKRNIKIYYDTTYYTGDPDEGQRTYKLENYPDSSTIPIPFPSDPTEKKCFRGWSRTKGATEPDADFSDVYEKTSVNVFVTKVTEYVGSEDAYVLNLYAVWGDTLEVNYYDSLHLTDGKPTKSTEHVNREAFKTKKITEEGHDLRWTTEQNGGGTSYNSNAKITVADNELESMNLHSQWRKRLRYGVINGYDEKGNQVYSGSDHTDFYYLPSYTGDVNTFYKAGSGESVRTAASDSGDVKYKSVNGYNGVRLVLNSSTDISQAAAVNSLSVSQFKKTANNGLAYMNDDRFTIQLKAIYEPEKYTITAQLNRPGAFNNPTQAQLDVYKTETDYRELSNNGGTTVNGLTNLSPTEDGLTFSGWTLYDAAGQPIKTIAAGGTFAADDFAGKGENFTVRDQWKRNYRIIPHANNAECATTPSEATGTIELYASGSAANITATISGNMYTKGYEFVGYSTEADSSTANIKDGNTSQVSIDKFSTKFRLSADKSEYVIDIYGQWYKNLQVNFDVSPSTGSKTQSGAVWLSTIQPGDTFTFTQPDNCNPSLAHYTFSGDWSTEKKIAGQQQNQPVVTSIPISDFAKITGTSSVFEATVYAVYTPNEYKFIYLPDYSIDNVISDANNVPGVTGFPAEMNAETKTVKQNYDTIKANSGYQLSALSANGYRFDGWYICYGPNDGPTSYEKEANFKVPTNWIESTDTNGMNQTVYLRARWHKYSLYTFLFNINAGNTYGDGLSRPQKVGSSETITQDYFVGTFKEMTDDDFYPAVANESLRQWQYSLYSNQITEDMYFKSGSSQYLKLKNGMPTATGYVFKGWKVKSYTTDNASTATDTITYNGVTYGFEGNQGTTFSVDLSHPENYQHGIYKGDLDDACDTLFIITARWEMQRMVKFDMNVPSDEVATVTNFTAASPLYDAPNTGNSGWTYDEDYDQRKAVGYTTPSRPKYNFRGWSLRADTLPGSSDILTDTGTGNVGVYSSSLSHPAYDNTNGGYFYTQLYAVWEPLNTYTFRYDRNLAGLSQEGYPAGEYLRADDAGLNSDNWKADRNIWEDVYDEDDIRNTENYFPSGTGSAFKVKNGLLVSDKYHFKGWTAKRYVLNADYDPDTDTGTKEYLHETQGYFRGYYMLEQTSTFTVTDASSDNGIYSTNLIYQGKVANPTIVTLTAIWEPIYTYTLQYDPNFAALQTKRDFLRAEDSHLTDLVWTDSAVEGEEGTWTADPNDNDATLEWSQTDGVWQEVYTNDDIADTTDDTLFVTSGTNRYLRVKKGYLKAKGYKFTGWELTVIDHAGTAKKVSGLLSVSSDKNGIHTSNLKDDQSMRYVLTAQWEPQYVVEFKPNAGSETVTNMPSDSSVVTADNFTGSDKVFNGTEPVRTNYYFRGWSTDPNCKPEETAKILRYGSGHNPTVPKTAFTEPTFNADKDPDGYLVARLYAVWEPKGHYTLYYDKKLDGLDNAPWKGQYLTSVDEAGNTNPLGGMSVNEDGRWYEYVFEEGMAEKMVDGYYPLTHTKLYANGYKFVGWDMYYNRKGSTENYISGPYRYRVNNSGGFNSSYGIYHTWFNENDCVDKEFYLYAVWEPQYQVFYYPGTDDPSVTGMPDPAYSSMVSNKQFGSSVTKVFRASAPKRSGYYFIGWSTKPDCDVDQHPEHMAYVLHRNHLGPSVPKTAFTNAYFDALLNEGYLAAKLYAVWSRHEYYTLYFDENSDSEAYPGIEYLGEMTGHEMSTDWTVFLTHQQVENITGKYYNFDRNTVPTAKGYKFTGWDMTWNSYGTRLLTHYYNRERSNYGIYKGWINPTECPDLEFFLAAHWEPQYKVVFHDGDNTLCESDVVQGKAFVSGRKVFKPSVVPTKSGKYLAGWSTKPDYNFAVDGTTGEGFVKGIKNVTVYKSSFTTADYNDADQGFLRSDLYAVWSDEPMYYIFYDANEEGLINDPFVGQYTGAKDPDMVWEEVLTQTQLNADIAANKGYPLHRGYLTAKGYIFTGWQLTYIRESTDGTSGRFYSVDAQDNSFKIYPTWFGDVVDNEFLLSAVWKPQFAVKFFPNGDNVTNMPSSDYSPLKEEGLFTGNPATAVFKATVPKREGYYFAGWSTDPYYDVTQGLDGLLHRNHIGPAVPKDACTHAEYSDTAPYDYKGFMCAYVYAIWSPTPVYNIVYDPNQAALVNGEYLSDSMPAAHLLDGQWVFSYTQSEMEGVLSSAEGDNNAAGYYPLEKGELTAKGYVYTGWTLHWNDASGSAKTHAYPVSHYGQDAFRIHKNRLLNDTSDYEFLLTANWEPRYSVAFHENAGDDTVTNMPTKNPSDLFEASDFNRGGEEVKIFSDKGENITQPPQREGYLFLGWSTVPNEPSAMLQRTQSGVYVYLSDCIHPVENSFRAELYAMWTRGYSVSYELTGNIPAGVSGIPPTQEYPTGTENISVEQDMTAPGHTFSGWSVKTAPDGFAVSGGKFKMPEGDVVFTGSFTPNSHNVIYMVGDSVHDSKSYDYGTEVTRGGGVSDPTKTNAVFKGWKLKSGITSDKIDESGKFTMPDNEVVFEAEFEATYQVSYIAKKDGENYTLPSGYEAQRFAANKEVTVKPDLPEIEGYTFSGWSVQSPGGVSVSGGQFTMPAGDVVLFGEYSVKRANVIYYDDDDTLVGDEQTYFVDDEVTRGLDGDGNLVSTPEHEGFTFIEWEIKDDSIDESAIAANGKFRMPENDVKFRAVFHQNIRLIYDPNGRDVDQVPANDEFYVKTGDSVTRELDSQVTPESDGELFRYWSASPDGEKATNLTVSYKQSGLVLDNGRFNVKVYAIWSRKYTVSYKAYDANGNVIALASDVYGDRQYYDGNEVTLAPALTDDKYTFSGWKPESPNGPEIIQNADGSKTFTMPAEDVVFVGRFTSGDTELDQFTITYKSGLSKDDAGYTEDLGQSHEFTVTADENGKANHKVLANNSPELKYVRAGYTFAGWKLTKVQPDPNPAPGGKGTVVAPKAYAANGLISGGDVITIDSSVVLTAQWTKKPVTDPKKGSDKPLSPGTGESSVPMVIAFNLAIISMLAAGAVLRRRRAS